VATIEGSETVLVVDDETFMLSLADSMLIRHGYSVLTATSAPEVLHMFEIWPDLKIDVAILDVVMPGMDGFELAERIRKIRPGVTDSVHVSVSRKGRTAAGEDPQCSVCAEAVQFTDARREDSRNTGQATCGLDRCVSLIQPAMSR
jgi:CheY-like chemotaxis protein